MLALHIATGTCRLAKSDWRATAGIPKALHDDFAHFMAAVDPQAGLEEALALSGISVETELKLSRKAAKFRRALRCLQAMIMGASDAAAFREFPLWNTHLSESTPLEAAPGGLLTTQTSPST